MTRTEIDALINDIETGLPNTALKVRTALFALSQGAPITGFVQEMDVPTSYIAANFDASGLGTNEMLGWAICNGSNGTRDRGGRVSLGYNSTYNVLGDVGGNGTVTLTKNNIPQLDLVAPVSNADNGGGTKVYIMATDSEPDGAHTYVNSVNATTANTAVDIKQPYIVSLFVMKL